LHDGLADTRTLDAQLVLIRHARERLVIVNTFPLLLEVQRALIAAAKRGVRVQIIFGNVRPHFGAGVPFAGGAIRQLADQLVRSRLDAVIASGGEAYELCVPLHPSWDPELGRVLPHVHAKLMLCDERAVAVGSANLDVTAAYWESEALLIVQDKDFARAARAAIDGLIAQSSRIDPEDERWKAAASQRAWLSRNWPSLIS
jgi:phosphatidylserine/phosphatidylglycerophosphate/cardiolipin synthase-like enzyme